MGLFTSLFSGQIERVTRRAVDNAYYRGLFQMLNAGQSILDPDNYDYNRAYSTTGAVYECVDLIIKKIVAAPRLVYRIKDAQQYKVYKNLQQSSNISDRAKALKMRNTVMEEVRVPKIDKLLKQPNEKQNGDEFIRMLAGSYLLRGNSFIYGNAADLRSKKWTEIFALPAILHIVSGGMFDPIKEYVLNYGMADATVFPNDQVKHLKTFNPNYSITGEHLYGLSPLMAYLYSIDNIDQGNKQAGKQLKNGGRLGFLSPRHKEDQLSTPQKATLKESITQAHSSADKLSRIMPSAIPLDWTEIGLSSADMELLEIKGVSADDIYLCYHVPLQFRRNDASSYNNLTTAKKAFIYDAVAPIADEISSALTDFICRPYLTADKEEYEIRIDYSSLPELAADMKELTDWLAKSYEITLNERRELKGFGRLESPGMDEIFVPQNYVRLSNKMKEEVQSSGSGSGRAPAE